MVWKGQRLGLSVIAGLVLALLWSGVGIFQPQIQVEHHQPARRPQIECVRNPALCAEQRAGPAGSVSSRGTPEPSPAVAEASSVEEAVEGGRKIPMDDDLPPDPWQPPGDPVWFQERRKRCPARFLSVNTHTWGRHHNQLQSTVLGLLAAQLLNRTFVLGHFRHNHHWLEARDFYDFSQLQRHFCVIDYHTAVRLLKGERSVECFGQVIHDMPLGKYGRMKCTNGFGPVDRFFHMHEFRKVVSEALPHMMASTARVINLSGQLAFFLRPGLKLMSQGFGLLRPAADVAEDTERFRNVTFGPGSEYLAVHLRYREGQCMNEIQSDFQRTFNISEELLERMQEQCTINYRYADRTLQESLGPKAMSVRADPNRFCCPTFFASDHQNRTAEQDFLTRGAAPYKGRYHTKELGGLKGLSADYFLLRGGHTFIGNSASSISQDVCFGRLMRLPWRRACAGWHLPFFRGFARTEMETLIPPEHR
eukprot:Hpha_TRINITY_DN35000_c0_g1::TRINITY_DN35000_c0_g1_i1::g.82723::m.82723